MASSFSLAERTSMYSTSLPFDLNASRAAVVWGHVFLPKINTFSDMWVSSFSGQTTIWI
jgi:hypothetical protein